MSGGPWPDSRKKRFMAPRYLEKAFVIYLRGSASTSMMELSNGMYTIQGIDVTSLCQEFGTPVYVYDGKKIIDQLKSLKNAFSDTDVRIMFAAKSLTNISILKLLKNHGSGVDAVSINEAKLALRAGFLTDQITFTPNCVDFEEIVEGVDLGLNINPDNLSGLDKFGQKY